jgi:hypothetical protein
VLFHHIAYFIPVFIRVFGYVHISDRFAYYLRDYHRSSVFAYILCYYCFLSHIHLFGLLWWVGNSVWFQFRKNRNKVRWGERPKFEWNTSGMMIIFIPLTNFTSIIMSDQNNTPPPPRVNLKPKCKQWWRWWK